jgi:HEAT repeat protein
MKRCVQTDVVLLVMELLTGDEVRSLEAAKHLIAQPTRVDPELLAKVVADPGYKPWSKIASAYVLGFIPIDATSKHQQVLRETLANARASVRLRTHAAEALGNLKDKGSTDLLKSRLLDEAESTTVRKWCIYALAEMKSSAALATLRKFALTKPQGMLAHELESVGIAST